MHHKKLKVKKIYLFSLFGTILLLHSCYYDSKEYLFPELAGLCDTTNITYSGSVQPIIQANCLACHSTSAASSFGGNIRLEAYSDVLVRAQNGSLVGTISHAQGYSPMPKGSAKMSNCNIIVITKWVDSGAPNN